MASEVCVTVMGSGRKGGAGELTAMAEIVLPTSVYFLKIS